MPLHWALCVSTGQSLQGTGQLSGARWPSACSSFKRCPFDLNGHEPFSYRCVLTGQTTGHGTGHRTNVRCVLLHTRAPTVARQSRPSHRTERTGQNFPVRCSVRCLLHSTAKLGFATGHTGRVTGHVRCTPRANVRCLLLLCLALQLSPESTPSPDRSHRTKHVCPVLCPVHSRALFSTPFFTLAHNH